jgi:adenosine deaminase
MTERTQLASIVHELPKIDLHRHLVGSIRIKTLLDIAVSNNIALPIYDLEKLTNLIEIKTPASSLRQFLKPLNILGLCFYNRKTIARIAYEVAEDAAKDNVKYLELGTGPAFEASFHNLSLEEVFEGIIQGIKKAEEKYEIKVNLLAGPTFKWKERNAPSPEEVLETATKYKEKVVGFGLPAESKEGVPFSKWNHKMKREYVNLAKKAKEEGFGVTVHAGEVGTPESVIDAIKFLKANRIGHGIKIAQSQDALRLVVERKVPLEICLTSNIKSGVIHSWKEHPITQLWKNNVIVTINTDDPTLCQTMSTREYNLLLYCFNFSIRDIQKTIINALNSAFITEKEKEELHRLLKDT